MIRRASPWICRARPWGLASRRIDVRSGGLDTILAAQTADRSRLVLNLDKMMQYAMKVDGNNIYITLGQAGGQSAAASAAPAASSDATPAVAPGVRSIDGIDFRRSVDGAGRVVVRTDRSAYPDQPAPGG